MRCFLLWFLVRERSCSNVLAATVDLAAIGCYCRLRVSLIMFFQYLMGDVSTYEGTKMRNPII